MPSPLTEAAVRIAVSQLGVRERGRNAGPEVEEYLASVGLGAGYPWCAAFLHWLFRRAATETETGTVNPCPRTAGAVKVWALADAVCRDPNPARGSVYVLDHGHGIGHVGIVESIDGNGMIAEISGNTNRDGSREGDSVWRHRGQPEVTHGGVLLGYLDFSRAVQPPLVA